MKILREALVLEESIIIEDLEDCVNFSGGGCGQCGGGCNGGGCGGQGQGNCGNGK